MKKFILSMMVLGLVFNLMAQKQFEQKKNKLRVLEGTELIIPQEHPVPILNQKITNEDINRIYVGKAANQRTIRREETHVISYNEELDVISITFVLDPETYDEVNNIGDLGIVYSEDHGHSWSYPVLLLDNADDGHLNEYPSGIIYNPTDNVDLLEAYGVSQNTTKYNDDYFYKVYGTRQLNGNNHQIDIFEDPQHLPYNGYWNMFGLNQYGDQVYCMNMIPQGDWGAFETAELQPIIGEFNGDSFDWDFSNIIDAELAQESDNRIVWTGQYQGNDAGIEIVWSSDGEIGYMWMVGVWDNEPTGYQPIIFMTTDAGFNWDFVELDFLNDNMQEFLDPYIIESSSGLMIPHIFETAGIVDYSGELHLFVAMGSTSADVINHPDSIGWHYGYPGDIFSFVINEDGINENRMIWVDSLNTENVLQDSEGNYATDGGWQHRLSVAKSDEYEQIFLTWLDTRDDVNNELNYRPDIFGWTKCSSLQDTYGPICFTEGTLYETFYFFTYGADKVIYDYNTGNLVLPYMTGVSPAEFSGNTSTRTDPVTISYITGIEFPLLLCGEAVNEIGTINGFSVTQNTPNPFNGATTINVNTHALSSVVVEVSNMMGQTIYTLNSVVNGTKEIDLHSNNMEAGVYFYTVTVGSETITKKMIVN